MQKSRASFTVFFEDPFWVGVYEREEPGGLTACRVVFGAEPKDGEIYEWMLCRILRKPANARMFRTPPWQHGELPACCPTLFHRRGQGAAVRESAPPDGGWAGGQAIPAADS